MCCCVGGPDDVIYVYMCMLLLRLNSIRQRKPYAVQIAIVCVRRWCVFCVGLRSWNEQVIWQDKEFIPFRSSIA